MLVKPLVFDGGLARQQMPGDTLAGSESVPATVVTTAITLTGAQILQGILLRNPAAAGTVTIDTAANIIAAIQAGIGVQNIPNGTTWRLRHIVTTANADTLTATANTGITVNRGITAASSAKDYLITVNNGTPAQSFQANTTNTSAVVSGLTAAQCALLTPGMIVTNAVNGLQGTTILAVNPSAGTVTMSGNANATSTTPVTVSFSPVVTIDGLAP